MQSTDDAHAIQPPTLEELRQRIPKLPHSERFFVTLRDPAKLREFLRSIMRREAILMSIEAEQDGKLPEGAWPEASAILDRHFADLIEGKAVAIREAA